MKKLIHVILQISFVLYLSVLFVLLFLGSRGFLWPDLTLLEYIQNSANFVPFKTIKLYITAIIEGSMNIDIPIKNLWGNVILFLPMGIYLPYFSKKVSRVSRFTIVMITLLVLIEVIQILTRRGSFDIDDLILNVCGAWIGFSIWKTKSVQQLLK